ncbi:MAG: sigma-70 family RNA polymerase sigma factor [Planctomycetes bacterium]|nr:sigma-70 family RNA polymerase sigma factor [Planctomycetota bacterium]
MSEKYGNCSREEAAELVRKVAEGDEDALEVFYNTYFPRLYRYIYYRVNRDHHHTEEVVNDTFVESLEKAGEYDMERGSVDSWLITISRNRIRSSNSLMGKAREYEKSWSMVDGELESLFADLDEGNLPEAALEREELHQLVGAVMGSLSENYAKLLELKYMKDLTVRDIAALTQKTEKAIESQLTRARVAFRETFQTLAGGMPVV